MEPDKHEEISTNPAQLEQEDISVESESVEVECFGLDYERYSLGKNLKRMAQKYEIRNVLELPAGGERAMHSMYSLGFGLAGCKVTLVNGMEESLYAWEKLGIDKLVEICHCEDLLNTNLDGDSYDFVWNFACYAHFQKPNEMLSEMVRLSRKYVAIFNPNAYNPGYLSHRVAHYFAKVPWTHGDTTFFSPRKTRKFLRNHGLKIVKVGVLDCPPWPDSVGFRDIRLHRLNRDLSKLNWHARYLDYMCDGNFPKWIKAVNIFESIPVPLLLKFLYSHIFYVIAQKEKP